jgi:hypothetical protein
MAAEPSAPDPGRLPLPGFCFFCHLLIMRTYDKLIATILLAKARDGLRSYFGSLPQVNCA